MSEGVKMCKGHSPLSEMTLYAPIIVRPQHWVGWGLRGDLRAVCCPIEEWGIRHVLIFQ